MDTTVRTRPNHYEVLGLSPDASSDEIAQAFARELRTPRAFGSLAAVTVAFETLRDPAKRKAYDESLAPKPKPEPLKPTLKSPADWTPFVARPSVAELPAIPPAPPPARPAAKPHRLLERLDSKAPSSPRAVMPEPIRAESPKTEPAPRIDPAPQPDPEPYRPDPIELPASEGNRALHFFEDERGHENLLRAIKWNVPAFIVGCLLLSILAGAWTGLNAGGDDQADQPKRFARLKIASAEPPAEVAPELAMEAPTDLPIPATLPPAASTLPKQRIASTRQRVEKAAVEEAQLEADAAAQASVEPAAAEATPASMPLPNAVVARTIGRIGYPCGSVASSSALGGGTFKVTCTSGHSYRAAPVGGRYRFKRLG